MKSQASRRRALWHQKRGVLLWAGLSATAWLAPMARAAEADAQASAGSLDEQALETAYEDPDLDVYVVEEKTPRKAAEGRKMKASELRELPGSFGDPLRAMQALPGVSVPTWPVNYMVVRGSNPGTNGIFIDDIEIPMAYHFLFGPGVVHPYMIESLEFHPGSYGAEKGGFIGGISEFKTRQTPMDRPHVELDARVVDVGAIVTTPLGRRHGLQAAGRYSYAGALLSALSSSLTLNYWDYQLRTDHVFENAHLSLLLLGSDDAMDFGDASEALFLRTGFHRQLVRHELYFGNFELRSRLATAYERSTLTSKSIFNTGIRAFKFDPNVTLIWSGVPELTLSAGTDAKVALFRPIDTGVPGQPPFEDAVLNEALNERDVLYLAGFVKAAWRPGRIVDLETGLRVEGYSESGETQAFLSPRLALALHVTPSVDLYTSAGRLAQMASMPILVPGFNQFGLSRYGLQRAWQGAVGARLSKDGLEVDLSVFANRGTVTDIRNPVNSNITGSDYLTVRDGLAYGIESLLRRPSHYKFSGFVSHTFSRAERKEPLGLVLPSMWDQRHNLNAAINMRFGKWSMGSHAQVVTGRPAVVSLGLGDTRLTRLPTQVRLDLRAERGFKLEKSNLIVYLEVANVLGQPQYVGFLAGETEEALTAPLPMLGVRWTQ